MAMGKYVALSIIAIFWVMLPHVFLLIGINAIEKTSVQELTEIDEPTQLNLLFVLFNWFAFYYKLIFFSLPNAPAIVKLFLIAVLIMTVLMFISVWQKD